MRIGKTDCILFSGEMDAIVRRMKDGGPEAAFTAMFWSRTALHQALQEIALEEDVSRIREIAHAAIAEAYRRATE